MNSIAVCLVALLICLAVTEGRCADKFEPIPKELVGSYHIDFAKHLFPNANAEKLAQVKLDTALADLTSFKGKVCDSANNVLRALRLNDCVQELFLRHYIFLYLKYAVNTEDEKSLAESVALEAKVNGITAFMREALAGLDDERLRAFTGELDQLQPYVQAINSYRRHGAHTLSLKEEELLNTASPITREWPFSLYQTLRTRIPSADPVTLVAPIQREDMFTERYAALNADRTLYAFTLNGLINAGNQLAVLHRFKDAPEEAYFKSYWTTQDVDTLVNRIAEHADVYKRYERVCSDNIKKSLGLEVMNVWDLTAENPTTPTPRYRIDEASHLIRSALKPLGEEYSEELKALLDPANGRMDIVPGEHRKRGGFSQGFTGTVSSFYSSGFAGTYNDMRVLAHESTHAVHRQLMNRHQVLADYAEGPHYLFEAFAMLNELLLANFLYEHEADPSRKQFYLERFLDKAMEMFQVAPEVALENAAYRSGKDGKAATADRLDALTDAAYSRFSIWQTKAPALKGRWMNVSLMYEDPFYDFNYVAGSLLTLTFYQMYIRDARSFIPRYNALMQNGFTAPPATLLKQFLDIDVNDPKLVADAIWVLEQKIDDLEASYAHQ